MCADGLGILNLLVVFMLQTGTLHLSTFQSKVGILGPVKRCPTSNSESRVFNPRSSSSWRAHASDSPFEKLFWYRAPIMQIFRASLLLFIPAPRTLATVLCVLIATGARCAY